MQAIKDYENNKWKVIGQKVGKPAKVRTHFTYLLITASLAPLGFLRQHCADTPRCVLDECTTAREQSGRIIEPKPKIT